MGFFTNLRLRRKLLFAMIPLVLMVVAAGIYSSFESSMIDGWYSAVISTQVEALRNVGEARAHTNRFGLFLFELADETDPDRRQVIDGQLPGCRRFPHGDGRGAETKPRARREDQRRIRSLRAGGD